MAACSIEFDGQIYTSVECAYQAARSVDHDYRAKIQRCSNPVMAKRMAKSANTVEDWDLIKVQVMTALLMQKFRQPKFRDKLLATGEIEIIEGNDHGDRFWGMVPNEIGVYEGQNQLGRLLMRIRAELKQEINGTI